jgi:hypothetical protein
MSRAVATEGLNADQEIGWMAELVPDSASWIVDAVDEAVSSDNYADGPDGMLELAFELAAYPRGTSASPAHLFDTLTAEGDSSGALMLDGGVEVLAMPGDRLSEFPAPGTLILERALGEGALATAYLVASAAPWSASSLSSEQRLHGEGDGIYAQVIRSWPTPIHLEDKALLKIADGSGRLLPDKLLLQIDLDAIVFPIEDEEEEETLEPGSEDSFAEVVDPHAVRRESVRLALRERRRWIGKTETSPEMTPVLQEYYRVGVGRRISAANLQDPGWQRRHPWSAVFISWLMRTAGAEGTFHYSSAHKQYIAAAKRNRLRSDRGSPFWAYRVSEVAPDVGDLVCAARANSGATYDNIDGPGHRATHCDIVTARSAGSLQVIGGNVSNRVERKTLRTDASGHVSLAGRQRHYFAVIRIRDSATSGGSGASGGRAASSSQAVLNALRAGRWRDAVRLAMEGGQRDENVLTNMIFYTRHPELPVGYRIKPDEGVLARDWMAIRNSIVRPMLGP